MYDFESRADCPACTGAFTRNISEAYIHIYRGMLLSCSLKIPIVPKESYVNNTMDKYILKR